MNRRYFILGAAAALAAAGGFSWDLWRKFGSLPDKAPDSPHWQNGAFANLPDDYVYPNLDREPLYSGGWLKFALARADDRYPPGQVPSRRINLHDLEDGDFVWLGHSSFLVRLAGKTVCIDPVLSGRASPVPFTIPAWPGSTPYAPEDFPYIDYLCISHDHWDHLDYRAVTRLQYGHVLCGKGVEAHFGSWGLPGPRIFDWYDEWRDGGIKFVFVPSRHFSGRGFTRNQSLWGGFVLDAGSGGRLYFTGDGGYGNHFAYIGKRYGPFEIAFPDSGQYNRAWAGVHMFPEQAVMAARAAGARLACPAHIGKFTLSWHPWDEPVARFRKYAEETGTKFMLPVIGEKRRMDERFSG